MKLKAAAALLLMTASQVAGAQTAKLPRTDGNVRIDGVLDDAAWADAIRIELGYEVDPAENREAPVKTVAWLMEDGSSVYVGFRADDPEPELIRAWLRERDSLGSNDHVGISLDTYDDGRRAFEFFANPLGVQLDRTFDDASDTTDSAWDAVWESAGRIVSDGYVVEMRIPLSQLRFQDAESKQVWRYRLMRSWPRSRSVSLSNAPKDKNRNCSICQYPRLEGLAGSKSGKDLEIVPTLTASHFRAPGGPGASAEDTETDAGLSIRYGVTPEITVNLAINPDFSHVEADSTQLDVNNRFTSSLPEKRPLFLEGADYFRTPHEAVFTRSIGRPEVAAKLTGKRGANTIATFVARDEVTNLLFPGPTGSATTTLEQANTAFVGRYSRSFRDTSSVGALLTVRSGEGYRNTLGGLDTRWRMSDHHEFLAQVLESRTTYPDRVVAEFDQPAGELEGRAVLLRHAYESRSWFANVNHWQVDGAFRADAGFMTQAGSGQQEMEIGHKWWGGDSRWWSRVRLRGVYEIKHREDGLMLEETYIAGFDVSGPLQSKLDIKLRSSREYDSGRYFDLERLDISTQFEPFGGLQMGLDGRVGKQVDYDNLRLAEQLRLEPFVTWNVNRNLDLRIDGSMVALETPSGQPIFDASILDARALWHFNLRSYLRLTLQQRDIERNPDAYAGRIDQHSKDVGRQLLYSWKLNPQTVFFLGYSDAYAMAADLDKLRVTDRRWFLKLGYGFAM